jgi:tetratricopeptide (TPR) repeat protein
MQRSASTRKVLGNHGQYKFPQTILILILLATLVCIPAQGSTITAGISTASPAGSQLSAAAYEREGMALMTQENWNQLITRTNEGLALYPGDAELYCLKGYALRKTGLYTEAVDNVTRGIALDPRPVRYANRGYAQLALGHYDDALNDADTAIALNASYATAYGVKAIALLQTGNLTGASQTIDTVMSLDPENAHYWQVKGKILAALGNCTGATEAFQRSITINPDYSLPWPGFTNATIDLGNTITRCAVPVQTPPTTRQAGFPAVIAGAALALAIVGRIR